MRSCRVYYNNWSSYTNAYYLTIAQSFHPTAIAYDRLLATVIDSKDYQFYVLDYQ